MGGRGSRSAVTVGDDLRSQWRTLTCSIPARSTRGSPAATDWSARPDPGCRKRFQQRLGGHATDVRQTHVNGGEWQPGGARHDSPKISLASASPLLARRPREILRQHLFLGSGTASSTTLLNNTDTNRGPRNTAERDTTSIVTSPQRTPNTQINPLFGDTVLLCAYPSPQTKQNGPRHSARPIRNISWTGIFEPRSSVPIATQRGWPRRFLSPP